jgi:hypothetical protein
MHNAFRELETNNYLGSPDTVVIHVDTNDLRRTVNLDYVMGDVYAVGNVDKTKFPQSKLTEWRSYAQRHDMASYRSTERQILLDTEDIGSRIFRS